MNLTIYTTPTCPYCHQAKVFLRTKKIPFTEFDVSENPEKAEEMVKLSGQMGVPVILVGKKMLIGFDERKIKNALKINE